MFKKCLSLYKPTELDFKLSLPPCLSPSNTCIYVHVIFKNVSGNITCTYVQRIQQVKLRKALLQTVYFNLQKIALHYTDVDAQKNTKNMKMYVSLEMDEILVGKTCIII